MRTVTLYHPDLPGTTFEAPESAVPHHRASGWTTDPPEQQTEQPASAQTAAEQPDAVATAQTAAGTAEAKSTYSPRKGADSNKER